MAYVCEVRRLEAQPAIAVRRRGDYAELGRIIPEGFATVSDYLRRADLQPAGEVYARYFEIGAGPVDVELGFTVRELGPTPPPPVQPSQLPAGEAVVTLHRGPYERLPEAMAALQAWLREHGRRAAGPFWEVYLNGPPEVTDPALFETEVVVPLSP